MKKLNENELESVNGGVLTPEAKNWIDRNYDAIVARAPKTLQWMVGLGMNYVTTSEQVFDVPTLKSTLKNNFGVDVDDLS